MTAHATAAPAEFRPEIGDPRPDCHVRLDCDTVSVNLMVSTSTEIIDLLPDNDPATKAWLANERLELGEVPGVDEDALAQLDEALVKAVAPFVPMLRRAVMSYLAMVQDDYRDFVEAEAAKLVPPPVLVVHSGGSITSPWPEES